MSGMVRPIKKRNWGPKRLAYVFGSAIVIGVVLYIWIFADFGSRLNVSAERLVVSTVERGEFQEFTAVTGTVIPINTYFLIFSS